MARSTPMPEMFFINGCLDDQEVIQPGVYSSDSSPLAQLWKEGSEEAVAVAEVVEGQSANETCELLESAAAGRYYPQSWTISFIKTYIVTGICVFGIFGNLLTLIVLSRKRLEVILIIFNDLFSVNNFNRASYFLD